MIRLDNLCVGYRRQAALQQVSGSFAAGSLTAVMGPNGAGKSSLLKALVGALPLRSGTLQLGVPVNRVAYLPQLAEIDRSFPIHVRDCVMLGAWGAAGAVRHRDHQPGDAARAAAHARGATQRRAGRRDAAVTR